MSSSRDKRQQRAPRSAKPVAQCIYCQKRPAVNGEDVVAKGLFGKPRPKNPVKVPSCRECNALGGDGCAGNMSDDEEYMRLIFCADLNAANHPVAKKLLRGEIDRSLGYQPRFRDMVHRSMGLVTGRTEAGILVPNLPAIEVRTHRIERVLRKVTRGLIFAASGRALPPDWRIEVSQRLDQAQFDICRKAVEGQRVRTDWFQIGDANVFRCNGGGANPHSFYSMWLLLFYEKIAFFTHTWPPDRPLPR